MGRTDRASRVIAAPPATVYGALLDRESLEVWLLPEGMRGRVERWDPRLAINDGLSIRPAYLSTSGCVFMRPESLFPCLGRHHGLVEAPTVCPHGNCAAGCCAMGSGYSVARVRM